MIFNENKYGVLTNWDRAWFFQRVQTANSTGKTMQCYGPVDLDSGSQPSMLKAFVGIILQVADSEVTSFHTSPTHCDSPCGRHFDISNHSGRHALDRAIVQAGSYHPIVVNGSYSPTGLYSQSNTDERVFHWRSGRILDLAQRGNSLDMLNKEVQNYATLAHLQGQVIPQVRGYYNIWGLLKLLALEDVGSMIPEAEPIDARIRRKMRSALIRIHTEGYVHGDIERRNFCRKGRAIFLVDLEQLRLGTPMEMQAELDRIDTL